MPNFADTSVHGESDSEEDLDYVPEGEEQDSDTSEGRDSKRPRVQSPPRTEEDLAAAKSERQALWAKFQESVTAPPASTPSENAAPMVKVEKRYRFAGEDVVEIVEVPEDSMDAKNWPLWKPPRDGNQDEAATPTSNGGPGGDGGASVPSTTEAEGLPPPRGAPSISPQPPQPPPPSSSSSSVVVVAPGQPQQAKRPGRRRKPKQQLAELPSTGAADSRRAGKKLTTLEKSALDWRAHVRDDDASGELSGLASELEANRRGGGYLEKVEFLQRVGDRKNQMLETNRDHKRRRG
ncbi:hypothetical protein BC826DRAFT_916823 [Russula brevipes]|nr:hypothetical protein BC826DRAFT_916823 [Russula brevipes]